MQLTSKQRATLRAMANGLPVVAQVGKGELTPAVLDSIETVLAVRELIKISLLRTVETAPRDMMQAICDRLGAEPVSCVGRSLVIYRPDPEEPKIVL